MEQADYVFMSILNSSSEEANLHVSKGTGSSRELTVCPFEATLVHRLTCYHQTAAEEMRRSNNERIEKLLTSYAESDHNRSVQQHIQNAKTGVIPEESLKHQSGFVVSGLAYIGNWVIITSPVVKKEQCSYLSSRVFRNALRNKMLLRAKGNSTHTQRYEMVSAADSWNEIAGQSIFFALLVGLIYRDLSGRNDVEAVQDRTGSLFFLCVNMVFTSTIGVLSIFSAEKTVFVREFRAGYYGLPAYFSTKILVELPFGIAIPIVQTLIYYWMVGYQNDAGKYFAHMVTIVVLSNCGNSMGIFFACAFSDLAVALAIVPLFLLPLMIFAGLFVNSDSIPVSQQRIETKP